MKKIASNKNYMSLQDGLTDALDMSDMNDRMYSSKYGPDYADKLRAIGLTIEDYERFSKIYDSKNPGNYVPLNTFIDRIDQVKQSYPEAFQDSLKESILELYLKLRSFDGQLSGSDFEEALAAVSKLYHSLK